MYLIIRLNFKLANPCIWECVSLDRLKLSHKYMFIDFYKQHLLKILKLKN
jgi:hypothetical protein